ncbi:gamma-glutamyltransferase family protein [Aeromicrobium chenweiae]|uniref:Gamma-glutamyltransferase n=1 Tax=Aeromicrobium chenweiae TaxID=2079793 RepID=A0A2S0WPA2_9ACTN|nr:gamma-glutamyltransferase [Aeromicrobium chenweiae]AWB93169.1 gamma-glutamyltransferase [Aeromicrobium chenweiae]TGN34159.1 gamma-glutamyltransferase [Aeromicrobium chenweiae]
MSRSTTGVRRVAQDKVEVLGTRGAVASSSPLISSSGARVLVDGGNAIDATLAMAATAWMALPGQCGIGGDAFVLVREPDGRVWTLNGSGLGPDGATTEFYRAEGHHAIPLSGALAVAVPGALAAVRALHAAGATRSLEELWAPAVRLGSEGVPCTLKTRLDITEHAADLARDPGAAAMFLRPDGGVPEVGQRLAFRELADFVAAAAQGREGFYDGSFGDRALSHLTGAGARFSGREWAAGAQVAPMDAIATPYGSATIHQTPVPSAGWMVLQAAAICDGMLRDRGLLDAESVHWMAEAFRLGFRDRHARCGSDNDGWQQVLAADAIGQARADIARHRASSSGPAHPTGDTTSTVCVDEDGRAVSFIHSLAFTFGSRVTVPGTGVVLNNRLGRGAYLIDGHPNEVKPGRKPLHTLNAWAVDHPTTGLLHVGSCPGGDGQVQWNMQVISHLLDHGVDPQTAVSLPRFTVFPGSDADVVDKPDELRCETGIPQDTLDQLAAWGHPVKVLPTQVGGPGGSAMAISVDHENGVLRAGADPRMEGVALAI